MKNAIINSTMNNIKHYYNYDDNKLSEIKYGLETLYLTITKTIILLIISVLFSYLKELILFMIFYGILRLTGFGLHAKKSIHCWISSLILFIGIPNICKYFVIPMWIKILISVITLVLIIIYAPADTEKRPLIHKNKRVAYKIITIIISIIYLFFIYYLSTEYLINILLFSLITECLMINPLSYKLMGVPYGNYKNYQNKKKKGVKK